MYSTMYPVSRDSQEDLNGKDIENDTLIRRANNYDAHTASPDIFQRYFNVHNIINSLLTVVLICSIIVTLQYEGLRNSSIENYYYYCVYPP